MRLSLLLCAVFLFFAACNATPKPVKQAQPVVYQSPRPSSSWFDLGQRVHSKVCLVTPNGIDIRQSAYLELPEYENYTVVARVRDYSVRDKGLPDKQWLVHFSAETGQGNLLAIPNGVFPERFIVAADDSKLCLGGISQDKDGSFNGNATLFVWSADGQPQEITLSGQAIVQRFTDEGTVVCREIPAAGVSGGLLAPALDWKAPLQEIVPPGLSPSGRSPGWQRGPDGSSLARQRVVFDPATPADAMVRIELKTVREPPEIFKHSFAYHVSYSPFQWEPRSAWVDESTLVVTEFLTTAASKQSRANHHGVFSLVGYSSAEMRRVLIAEHVEPQLGFAVGDGLIFFSLRRPGTEGDTWEVWVSSVDGLTKRLLWRAAEAQYVAVADYSNDGRLLIERQYFAEKDGRPKLHSELRELSVAKLSRGNDAVDPLQIVERITGEWKEPAVEPSTAIPPLIKIPPLPNSASGQ